MRVKVLPANTVNDIRTYGKREGDDPLTDKLAVDATAWSAVTPIGYKAGWASVY